MCNEKSFPGKPGKVKKYAKKMASFQPFQCFERGETPEHFGRAGTD